MLKDNQKEVFYMDYYSILSSLGVKENQIKRSHHITENNETLFWVEINPTQRKCVYCNSNANIKDYKTKQIKVLPSFGMKTYLELKLPRYKCKCCRKTYIHNLNISFNSLHKPIIKDMIEDFSKIITFSDIAEKYNVSPTKVINIFDEYCPNIRANFDEVLCIDEFSNIRKSDDKYACILVDFKTHKIIDIIKNRTLPYLRQYFSKVPLSVRDNVKFIITDMYDGYITIAKDYFHNSIIAIDPFHYVSYLTNAVQEIRRNLIKNGVYFKDQSWMGKHWRLITTNPKNLPNKLMTLSSGETISYEDRIRRYVRQDKDLEYAYLLLQDFYSVTKKLTYENSLSYIGYCINLMINSSIKELNICGYTWNHYKEYICNSFIKINGNRLSNGPIEGINSRVKTLKKIYCGYRNPQRFYNRIILIVNKKRAE